MQHERAHRPDRPGPSPDEIRPDEDISRRRRPRRLGWAAALAVLAVAALALLSLRGGGEPPAERPAGRPTPVRATLAERGDLTVRRQLPGELVGEAAALSPRVAGRLEAVRVRPGDRVEAGETVAVIDAAELVRERQEQAEQVRVVEANLRRAEARLAEARSRLRRAGQLAGDDLISEQELEGFEAQVETTRAEVAAVEAQIEQARARGSRLDEQLAETRVRAPFAGTVAQRFLDPGAVVQPGTPIVRVVDEGTLLVQFRAPERLLGQLVAGAPFTVATQATGERTFRGTVVRIAGEVARSDRTVLVEGELTQRDEVLRPGMYADVRVELEEIPDAVLVPGVAVVERLVGGEVRQGVFAVAGDGPAGEAVWRPIRVLELEGEVAAVTGDLEPGERVLTLGHEELADGSPVVVVEGPGSEAPGASDEKVAL